MKNESVDLLLEKILSAIMDRKDRDDPEIKFELVL